MSVKFDDMSTSCPECKADLLQGRHVCLSCGYNALARHGPEKPASDIQPSLDANASYSNRSKNLIDFESQVALVSGILLLLATSGVAIWKFQGPMEGPHFLAFYLLTMVTCWIGGELIRARYEARIVVMAPILVYAAVGLFRIYQGLQAGMHRFGLLILMIPVGSGLMWIGSKRMFPEGGIGNRCFTPVVFGLGFGLLLATFPILGWIGFLIVGICGAFCFGAAGMSGNGGGYSGGGGGCGGGGGGCGGGGCGGGGCGGCGGG